ncbi:MAG TPA: 3,4-dehydroadipyl-CoA semialdehyde dehydrogenase [Sandaracinaceae bacterium LLY-WYZ-13_1]|nr:3,4-dehydroadipyl-CoA semialdehyde dehydrogenase [Sandaracinaceae bacterium LLY-WYZ-13_1]
MITLESYLRGEWVRGQGALRPLVNPTTGETVAETGTEGIDFAPAVELARTEGGPALRAMTFAERGKMLKALSKAIHGAREELIEASILNGGTTRGDAKFDIDGASGTLAFYASLGKKLGDATHLAEGGEQLTQSARFHGRHLWVPLRGVAVHVNAFNFPAWGLAEKAAVALLAGVPVITKPATATALLAYRVTQKLVEADVLPRGALQFVAGSPGNLLDQLGSQDVLAFTGSSDTGRTLRGLDHVLSRSTRVNVEADSLNAAVVTEDVSDDTYQRFLRDAVTEITQKAGQKCTATRRIFVHASHIDRVQEDLAERLARITVGDPADKEVRMGPLATAQQRDDYLAGVEKLQAAGAKIVWGDPKPGEVKGADASKGFFVGPVLLRADAPAEADAVHDHEVFGPCSTLMPFEDVDEAAALVARGGGGLVASVYGDDRKLLRSLVLAIAPYSGRILMGTKKVADQAISPGMVLPSCVHGGPGRAGGGEELGGERGLHFYMQRCALQGDRALLEKLF